MSKRGVPPASQEYEFPEEESSELGAEGATAASAAEPRDSGEPAAGAAGGPSQSEEAVDDVPDLAVFFSMFPNCTTEEQVKLCRGYATYLSSLMPKKTIWQRQREAEAMNAEAASDPTFTDHSREGRIAWMAKRTRSASATGSVTAAKGQKRTKRYWEK